MLLTKPAAFLQEHVRHVYCYMERAVQLHHILTSCSSTANLVLPFYAFDVLSIVEGLPLQRLSVHLRQHLFTSPTEVDFTHPIRITHLHLQDTSLPDGGSGLADLPRLTQFSFDEGLQRIDAIDILQPLVESCHGILDHCKSLRVLAIASRTCGSGTRTLRQFSPDEGGRALDPRFVRVPVPYIQLDWERGGIRW